MVRMKDGILHSQQEKNVYVGGSRDVMNSHTTLTLNPELQATIWSTFGANRSRFESLVRGAIPSQQVSTAVTLSWWRHQTWFLVEISAVASSYTRIVCCFRHSSSDFISCGRKTTRLNYNSMLCFNCALLWTPWLTSFSRCFALQWRVRYVQPCVCMLK